MEFTMTSRATEIKRKVVRAGSDIKSKGLAKGLLNSGIDAIPFVGLAKNAVELFRGDFIPDKKKKGK